MIGRLLVKAQIQRRRTNDRQTAGGGPVKIYKKEQKIKSLQEIPNLSKNLVGRNCICNQPGGRINGTCETAGRKFLEAEDGLENLQDSSRKEARKYSDQKEELTKVENRGELNKKKKKEVTEEEIKYNRVLYV